jgi:hypothetical protein
MFAAVLACASFAAAGYARRETDGGQVTSCSRFGNGCMTVRTRKGRLVDEMQLPSGTWYDCRGDCRETLRQDFIDFWETQRERAP